MKLDKVFLTLTLLIFAQQLIAVFKQNITRYLIKTFFTEGRLPMARWYTMEFINSLNLQRVASLGIIATFTAVTFPLSLWITDGGGFVPLLVLVAPTLMSLIWMVQALGQLTDEPAKKNIYDIYKE